MVVKCIPVYSTAFHDVLYRDLGQWFFVHKFRQRMQYDLSCKTWHFLSPITSFPRVISLLCHKINTLSSDNLFENVHKFPKIFLPITVP